MILMKDLYETADGHRVRSRAEVIIDNLLSRMDVHHQYEKKIVLQQKVFHPDWWLPQFEAIIEFWGLEDDAAYVKTMNWKLSIYHRHNIPCLSLNDQDLMSDQNLRNKIQEFIQNLS
ncbi:MAG: hypothetical protein ACXAC7_22540, partial [Candidatus Hodarchaeales archaeon]